MTLARSHLRGLGAALVTLVALGVAATARGDDRVTAEALLAPIEHDPARLELATDAVKLARDSLERATRMRDGNDEPRARLAESLGLHWAKVARDEVRAAEAEKTAREARLAADDAGARAERERALLEEAIARQGRLRAEMEGLDKAKQGPDKTAAVAATAGTPKAAPADGGAPIKSPKTPGRGPTQGPADAGGMLP